MHKRGTDLSQFDNSWYQSGKGIVIKILWYCTNAVFFKSTLFPFSIIKVAILRCFGAKVGHDVVIKPSVNIKYPWLLTIGSHVWIGENVWIDNLAEVKIGNHVCLSQAAMLLTGNHNYTKSSFDLLIGHIILEDGVWIGAKSVVCPGVKCASHSVLTVGSIATKDLESYTIYRGNPAIKIKERYIST